MWFEAPEEREWEMMNRATLSPGLAFRLEERDGPKKGE
jgi:hypothetical protein